MDTWTEGFGSRYKLCILYVLLGLGRRGENNHKEMTSKGINIFSESKVESLGPFNSLFGSF